MNISLFTFAPDNLLVSPDGFGSPVPRKPAHLYSQVESGDDSRDSSRFPSGVSPVSRQPAHLDIQAESGADSRDSFRFPRRRPFICLNRDTPSGQSPVYRVTQLRTDGVHRRESADIGPVIFKVVPVTGDQPSLHHHRPINMRLSFPLIRAFGITGGWKATVLKSEVWVDTVVMEGGRRFMAARRKKEIDAARHRHKREATRL